MKKNILEENKELIIYNILILIGIILSALCILATISGTTVESEFGEEGFITTISLVLLGLCAVISFIKTIINMYRYEKLSKYSICLLLMSLAFVLLMIDEKYQLHENLDFSIHKIFKLPDTFYYDWIDDFIVCFYIILGMLGLWFFKDIFIKNRDFIYYIIIAIVIGILSEFFDWMSNNSSIVKFLFHISERKALIATDWLGIFEDSLKLFSEFFILSAMIFLSFDRRDNL